jgi:hypothetical protein
MRITGRSLRPSTVAERRLMLSCLGTSVIKVPRRLNPYLIARRLSRVARDGALGIESVLALLTGASPPRPVAISDHASLQ